MEKTTRNIVRGNLAKAFVAVKRTSGEGEARAFVHSVRELAGVKTAADWSLDHAPRGRGNAVSRRLGYTVQAFRCYCAWSPCQHEPIYEAGELRYYAPDIVNLDWRYLAQLKPSTRVKLLERRGR